MDCLEICEKACETASTGKFSIYLNKCKNDCPFFCECEQACSSEQSIDYCDYFCSSYFKCKATCKGEPNFCKRACEFDPNFNWIFLNFDEEGSARFYYMEDEYQNIFDQKIVKVWEKVILSNKTKQRAIKNLGPKYKKADYGVALWEINCVEKKMRRLQAIVYTLADSVIEKTGPREWNYVPPGTIQRELLEEVCEE